VVSFAIAFIQTVLPREELDSSNVSIKRNDLDAMLGIDAASDFITSVNGWDHPFDSYCL
jgi:hypothetical protein